jgi:hypothetical protein
VKELQEECQKMLAKFPTTSKKDLKILGKLLKLIMDASHQLDSSATFLALQNILNLGAYHPENNFSKDWSSWSSL